MVVKDIAEWRESINDDCQPTIGIYPTSGQAVDAYTYAPENKSSMSCAPRGPYRARVTWAWLDCIGEVKNKLDWSGYHFNGEALLNQTKHGVKARAGIASFAAEIMYRQHRTHVFMFYVCQTKARLMRWDRAGLIISEPIDLLTYPEDFLKFFCAMAKMTREELGYDTTATLASEAEIKMFKNLHLSNKHADKMRKLAISKPTQYPIYKVRACVHVHFISQPTNVAAVCR